MGRKTEYVGVLYDYVEDVIVIRSPVIRDNAWTALQDARDLIEVVNNEIANDQAENSWAGLVDETYVAVDGPHGIEDEDAIRDREYDEFEYAQQLRDEGRLPQNSPSHPEPWFNHK